MENDTRELLTKISNNLDSVIINQNEICDQLATILMAIYDIDTTPYDPSIDNSKIINGLKAIYKMLININEKQRPSTPANFSNLINK